MRVILELHITQCAFILAGRDFVQHNCCNCIILNLSFLVAINLGIYLSLILVLLDYTEDGSNF